MNWLWYHYINAVKQFNMVTCLQIFGDKNNQFKYINLAHTFLYENYRFFFWWNRSFTAPAGSPRTGSVSLLEMLKGSEAVSEKMLKMSRNSNVFRTGDYNDASKFFVHIN